MPRVAFWQYSSEKIKNLIKSWFHQWIDKPIHSTPVIQITWADDLWPAVLCNTRRSVTWGMTDPSSSGPAVRCGMKLHTRRDSTRSRSPQRSDGAINGSFDCRWKGKTMCEVRKTDRGGRAIALEGAAKHCHTWQTTNHGWLEDKDTAAVMCVRLHLIKHQTTKFCSVKTVFKTLWKTVNWIWPPAVESEHATCENSFQHF